MRAHHMYAEMKPTNVCDVLLLLLLCLLLCLLGPRLTSGVRVFNWKSLHQRKQFSAHL